MASSLQDKRDRYCLEICRGKCCVMHDRAEGEVRCPRLSDDGACTVYQERYGKRGGEDLVVIGYFASRRYRDLDGNPVQRPFWCGRIEQIIANGALPPHVAARCVYVHPELVKEIED